VIVGVPLIVITLDDQEAVTPEGKPDTVPIPVAPVVAIVIGVKASLTAIVGLEDGVPAELVTIQTHVSSPVEETLRI
jgi:hypothetical protein